MKRVTAQWIIFVALFIAGCSKVDSNDLKTDVPYFQGYTVICDKTAGTTSASAFFRVRDLYGARIELSDNNKVEINGAPGKKGIIDHTYYTWQGTGKVDVSFVLTKNAQTFYNVVKTTDIADITFQGTLSASFARSGGVSFSWSGADIASGETVDVSIAGRNILDTAMTESVSKALTGRSVLFTMAELQNIKNGAITISLSRTRSMVLDEYDGTGGGAKEVTITEQKGATLY